MLVRGQLTLEFLLLLAVFLAFLMIWLPTITKTRDDLTRTIAMFYKANTLSVIRNTADEICILGPGNSRTIGIALLENAILGAAGDNISLLDNYGDRSERTRCSVKPTNFTIKDGILVIENANGELNLRKK